MAEILKPGIYRHYKGNSYMVLGEATHTETEELFVVYRALYGNYELYIRPKEMFFEKVKTDRYQGPRFKLIKEFKS